MSVDDVRFSQTESRGDAHAGCRMSRIRNSKALRVGLQGLFIGVVLFFLIRTLAASRAQIIAFPWHFRILPLIGSLGVSIIAGVFWASVWRLMVVQTGSSIAWADGVRVYLVSNLAKFVPGSIWGYVGRAYLGRDYGVTLARVGVSTVWEVGCRDCGEPSVDGDGASVFASRTTLPGVLTGCSGRCD